jgi:hypothetical protein
MKKLVLLVAILAASPAYGQLDNRIQGAITKLTADKKEGLLLELDTGKSGSQEYSLDRFTLIRRINKRNTAAFQNDNSAQIRSLCERHRASLATTDRGFGLATTRQNRAMLAQLATVERDCTNLIGPWVKLAKGQEVYVYLKDGSATPIAVIVLPKEEKPRALQTPGKDHP